MKNTKTYKGYEYYVEKLASGWYMAKFMYKPGYAVMKDEQMAEEELKRHIDEIEQIKKAGKINAI